MPTTKIRAIYRDQGGLVGLEGQDPLVPQDSSHREAIWEFVGESEEAFRDAQRTLPEIVPDRARPSLQRIEMGTRLPPIKEKGVNIFEGTPCPTCASPLRVVEINTVLPWRTPEGRLANDANYECEGPDRHGFGTLCLHVGGKWGPPALHPRNPLPVPSTQS